MTEGDSVSASAFKALLNCFLFDSRSFSHALAGTATGSCREDGVLQAWRAGLPDREQVATRKFRAFAGCRGSLPRCLQQEIDVLLE